MNNIINEILKIRRFICNKKIARQLERKIGKKLRDIDLAIVDVTNEYKAGWIGGKIYE